jgi:hypothetical protein
MSDSLGEKLPRVHVGDRISVFIRGDRYTGNVFEANREKCDLVSGFMEEGYIEIYLNLDSETVTQHSISEEYLGISAIENTPNDFESPTGSLYRLPDKEPINHLGEVTDIIL